MIVEHRVQSFRIGQFGVFLGFEAQLVLVAALISCDGGDNTAPWELSRTAPLLA